MTKENPSIWYVIPTYWIDEHISVLSSIYDHPTPIAKGKSTLPRTLDSLVSAFEDVPKGKGPILILVSAVQKQATQDAEKWVRKICAPYKEDLDLYFAGEEVVEVLKQEGAGFASDQILFANGYRGYGDVRNLQLILPAILGADWIYAIDDDEIVFPETIQRIVWHVEKATKEGVAGIYLNNEAGDFLVKASCDVRDVKNVLLDKGIYMNSTFLRLKEANENGKLPVSPLALGGNMLIPREMFLKVCFDPMVPRGEDIDFVLNAKAKGFDFVFDDSLTILHQPPRHLESDEYGKMKADVIRFVYEKAKVELFGLDVEDFDQYPGKLFRKEFENDALLALREVVTEDREKMFGLPEEILKEANQIANKRIASFYQFAMDWSTRLRVWQENNLLIEKILIMIN